LDDLEVFDCAQNGSVVEIPHLTVERNLLELLEARSRPVLPL